VLFEFYESVLALECYKSFCLYIAFDELNGNVTKLHQLQGNITLYNFVGRQDEGTCRCGFTHDH